MNTVVNRFKAQDASIRFALILYVSLLFSTPVEERCKQPRTAQPIPHTLITKKISLGT